jgi:hypothetical protein
MLGPSVFALGAELEDAVGVVPVVLQRLALDGEHRRARGGDGGGGVVLRAEDVARGPAHLAPSACSVSISTAVWMVMCSEPVMRAPLSGCARRILADRHQAGHLGLGDGDFLAAPGGQGQVGNGRIGGGFENSAHGLLQSKV